MSLVKASTHIQTDNTLSGITAFSSELSGNQHLFTLSEAQGQLAGSNLFYSFSQFNIGSGDTAWFNLNTPDLTHIISRVTGGNESFINGEIKVTNAATGSIPSFFFINPSGITLGPGASIDVPGSFYVSTASSLHFSDGSQYQTNDSIITSSLTTAPPESFGFLGNETGSLNLSGTEADPVDLSFKPLSNVGFVANNIHIEHADISNNKNNSEITINARELLMSDASISSTKLHIGVDDINLNKSNINVAAANIENMAEMFLSGKKLQMNNSEISATSASNISAEKRININIDSINMIEQSHIRADTVDHNNAGKVNINANELLLNNSSISSIAWDNSTGNAGNVTITASNLLGIHNNSYIASDTYSQGTAGQVSILAGKLEMNTGKNNKNPQFPTFISSSTFSSASNAGNANKISIDANIINMGYRSSIGTNTLGPGNGGSINISSNELSLLNSSSISSIAWHNSTGNAGNVTITANNLLGVHNNSYIASDTYSQGTAGQVSILADKLEMNTGKNNKNPQFPTFISSSTFSSASNAGNANKVNITANSIYLGKKAKIGTDTHGDGIAGDVIITTGNLITNNSIISSKAQSTSKGQTGNIIINAHKSIVFENNSKISVENEAELFNSNTSTGGINFNLHNSKLILNSSSISTSSRGGNGGLINIKDGTELYLQSSIISTSVIGKFGNGGDIGISLKSLIMNTGFIQANTKAEKANGGNIQIAVQNIFPSSNYLSLDSKVHIDFRPFSGLNVIQAAAQINDSSGTVSAPTPQLNLSLILSNLPSQPDLKIVTNNLCIDERSSNLLPSGKGGLPPRSRDFIILPISHKPQIIN